jgi:hypothetical protein
MKTASKKPPISRLPLGSALILTVVLTSLLAIVGVMFFMISRVDKIATSAISENKELNFAVDTIIAKISEELILDVPGVSEETEYYDYPGPRDRWLASLEPYKSDDDYYWQQISDVTGYIGHEDWAEENIAITNSDTALFKAVVPDYKIIALDPNGSLLEQLADADGDGTADSKWIEVDDITSSKGKPIYAAIRIIDNGGMLNVNTAYKFDPNGSREMVDGSSQMQINLMALAGRPGYPPTSTDEMDLLKARANNGTDIDYLDLDEYERNVIWRYGEPNGLYTPFDISDELELRYRFLLNNAGIDTRVEDWGAGFRRATLSTPITSGSKQLDTWFKRAYDEGSIDPNYAYRHLATIYNMDRIINPDGDKMLNVNAAEASAQQLYNVLTASIDPNWSDVNDLSAQLAVNMVDYRDSDVAVTTLFVGDKTYYGFEAQPFISDIACNISDTNPENPANNYFAVELYNPFDVDIPLGDFSLELRLDNVVVSTISLAGRAIAANSRFVITNSSTASFVFGVSDLMSMGLGKENDNLVLAKYIPVPESDPPTYALSERYDIYLLRNVAAANLYLDQQKTEDAWFAWDSVRGESKFYCRSDINWNVIYQTLQPGSNTLNVPNRITASRKNYNLEKSMGPFTTVGDITRVLTIGPSIDPNDMIGVKLAAEPPEELIRLDLKNTSFTDIFQYLTVIDPAVLGLAANEMRIKGRININTAPWFVMAQLPWTRPDIAQAIVAYRDITLGGFQSIGELMLVERMDYYAAESADLTAFPDLSPGDGAGQDFEERDVIFSRISNLVTVRSDVFTAYILVRIGFDGPQKRVLAILDRSNVNSSTDKVRVVALQPVPDPR